MSARWRLEVKHQYSIYHSLKYIVQISLLVDSLAVFFKYNLEVVSTVPNRFCEFILVANNHPPWIWAICCFDSNGRVWDCEARSRSEARDVPTLWVVGESRQRTEGNQGCLWQIIIAHHNSCRVLFFGINIIHTDLAVREESTTFGVGVTLVRVFQVRWHREFGALLSDPCPNKKPVPYQQSFWQATRGSRGPKDCPPKSKQS